MADGGPAFGPWAPLVSAVSGVFGVAISCVLTLRHFAPPPARSLPLISECGLRAPEKYVLLICVDASAFAGGWAILQVDFMLRSTAFERSDGDCAAVVRAAAGQRFDAIARANAALGLAACTALATTATLGIDRHEFLHSLSAKIFFLGGCGWSWLTTFLLFAKRPRPSLSLVLKVGLAFALSAAVVGFPVYVLTVVGIEKMRLEDRLDAAVLVGDARPIFEYVVGFLLACFMATLAIDLSLDGATGLCAPKRKRPPRDPLVS